MKQLQLFDLPDDFNGIREWRPLFDSQTMDRLANIGAMPWRNEIERRNHELRYRATKKETL